MLTVLLLSIRVEAIELLRWFRREIVSSRFSADPALLFSLARTLDRAGRIDLLASFCASALDVQSFVKLLSQVRRSCSPNGEERDRIAQAISRFASLHADIRMPKYEQIVRELLESRRPWERAHGLLALSSLATIRQPLSLRAMELIRDRAPYVRSNAWIAATGLLDRDAFPEAAKDSLLREARTAARDRYDGVRHNSLLFRQTYTRRRLRRRQGQVRR